MIDEKEHGADETILTDPLAAIDLNLLFLFDAVYRFNSVGTAALQLGITQSAASRALSRLRKLLGDPLFVKTNNRMLPTPRASEIAGAVSEIMAMVRETFVSRRMFEPETANRIISLALADVAEVIFMPSLSLILRQEAPLCIVHAFPIGDPGLKNGIENGAVNLIISNAVPPIGELKQQSLFKDTFSIIVNKASPLNNSIDLETYARAEHVVYQAPSLAPVLDNHLLAYGVTRKIRFKSRSMLVLPEMVSTDEQLIATVPDGLARRYMARGLVKVLKPDFALPEMQVNQYWHGRYDNDPFNRWLRQMLRRAVARSNWDVR